MSYNKQSNRSNYMRIGDFIQLVDERNKDLKITTLLGLSISKQFIPSVANTVGTNMARYKIIRKNQFACSIMQVRRDKKMPIAILKDFDEAIISQAYPVFEVKDTSTLLPDYLMMWMSRSEFDRHACFLAVGGVRGSLEWEDFLNMELPIPSIEKQRAIVQEYQTINKHIQLNEELIQKLEETAQAIYKHWFVDFEFPNENGMPYKSSGGKMVYNEELGELIPQHFQYISIQNLIDNNIIYKNQDGNHGNIHPKTTDYTQVGIPFIMAKDLNHGTLNLEDCNFISKAHSKKLRIGFAKAGDILLTHKATMGRVAIVPSEVLDYIVITPQVTFYRVQDSSQINKEFIYLLLNSSKIQNILHEESEQSTRKFLSITNQRLIKIIFPSTSEMKLLKKRTQCIIDLKELLIKKNLSLQKIANIIKKKIVTQ